MRSTPQAHRARPWRVHTLVPDFELIDVWRFELRLEPERGFDAFLATFWTAIHALERSWLSRIRVVVGRLMGWDAKPHSRPIPGGTEHSVAERLDATDRARNRVAADAASPLPVARVRPIYLFDDEALYELSNATVHALLHLGCAPGASPELAVYIKSRGLFTRLYMAAITPARYLVVYPALLSGVERRWRAASPERAPAVT
ncbi:MAG TPA: DUF2867 domain-containing protein [Candidatus Binatia bacterium]|jgi:hypothetical protein